MSEPREFRPAFPEWLRQREPLLAEEDTNGLFQAFRELRLRRAAARPWWRTPKGALGIAFGLLPPAFLLWFVSTTLLFVVLVLLPLVCLMAVARIHSNRSTRLPECVGELFLLPNIRGQAMQDLCLMPLRGRDVLIALYLESREQAIPSTQFLTVVAAIVVPLFWVISVGLKRDLLLHAIVVLPVFAWAIAGLRGGLLRMTEDQAISVSLTVRVATWKPPVLVEWRKILVQLVQTVLALLAFAVLGWLLLVVVSAVVRTISFHVSMPEMRWLGNFMLRWKDYSGIAGADLILLVIGLACRHRPSRAKQSEALEKLLAEGDGYYADFLKRQVMGDE